MRGPRTHLTRQSQHRLVVSIACRIDSSEVCTTSGEARGSPEVERRRSTAFDDARLFERKVTACRDRPSGFYRVFTDE